MIIKIMFTHGWKVEFPLRHYRHLHAHAVGLHSQQERRAVGLHSRQERREL